MFANKMEKYRAAAESAIEQFCVEGRGIPPKLFEAMRYSLKAGGKRIRPILCMAAAELSAEFADAAPEKVMPMALCIEIFHTSTLILDDLPCMDDDTLRRGKPTCHVVHGEALALLAGGGMPLWGMENAIAGLRKNGIAAERILSALEMFAKCGGPNGVFGGQALDIEDDKERSLDDVITVTSKKTSDLILASVGTGAILAGISGDALKEVESYGLHLGMCFQIVDDILDETASAEQLGKTPGKDKEQGKHTFSRVLGINGARKMAEEEANKAVKAIECFGQKGEFLKDFALMLLQRGN